MSGSFGQAQLHKLPAFVDMHTHLRTPGLTHKEDLHSATQAAVKGGYTVLNAMANTKPVCSSPDAAQAIFDACSEWGRCEVFQSVSLTRDFDGVTTSHLQALAGCNAVRCVSEDGYGLADGKVFLDAVTWASRVGKLPLIHAEDANFSASDMAAAEDLETQRDLYLLEKYGLRAHFCHVSTAYSAHAIIEAKKRGVNVTFEVTPHHIALNDSVDFKVNPPLRPESDRQFLIGAILDGWVDAIATDHAPHTAEDKQNGAPGLSGLETAFPVCYTVLCRENGLPLDRLGDLMSRNPARLLGANISRDEVSVCLDSPVVIDSNTFLSKGKNTPFDGRTYYGEVISTVKNGKIVYRREEV